MSFVESVVSRQHVGYGGAYKYPDPYSNAATLTFGICCGHPFRNGNKRTALVAMLAHLERSGLVLSDVRQRDLYNMIKAVAKHQLGVRSDPRKKSREYTPREADDEVRAIGDWIQRHSRKLERGERRITYRQLRGVLGRFGYYLDNPKNNSIGIYRDEEVRRGLLKTKRVIEPKRIGAIKYPGDNKVVGFKLIKDVRRMCWLDENHGCDTASFYDGADVLDVFVNEYRTVLTKLAKE